MVEDNKENGTASAAARTCAEKALEPATETLRAKLADEDTTSDTARIAASQSRMDSAINETTSDPIESPGAQAIVNLLEQSGVTAQFQIQSLIGEGRHGHLFKVVQPELSRIAVLKVLRSADCPEQLKRFTREAKILSKLNNAQVVMIFSFGILENKTPYYVMEHVDGQPLSSVIKASGAMEVASVQSIFLQVCTALEALHKAGMVHRDIAPSNIMVVKGEYGDQAKVIDFGLSKPFINIQDSQRLTKTGHTIGTPWYMSPEQCTGHQVDARSDIYAIGCVMYECLTGQPPFPTTNMLECMSLHVKGKAEPLQKHREELCRYPQLASIIKTCLEKDPHKRFQTATELRQALTEMSSQPCDDKSALKGTRDEPPRLISSAVKQSKQKLLLSLAIAAGVLTVFASAIYVSMQRFLSDSVATSSVTAFDEANRLAHRDYPLNPRCEQSFARALELDKTDHLLNPAMKVRALTTIMEIEMQADHFDKALEIGKTALDHTTTPLDTQTVVLVNEYCAAALASMKPEAVLQLYSKSPQLWDDNHSGLRNILNLQLADAYARLRQYNLCLKRLKKISVAHSTEPARDDVEVQAQYRHLMVGCLMELGRTKEARELVNQAMTMHPPDAIGWEMLADLCLMSHQYDQYERCISAAKALGDNDSAIMQRLEVEHDMWTGHIEEALQRIRKLMDQSKGKDSDYLAALNSDLHDYVYDLRSHHHNHEADEIEGFINKQCARSPEKAGEAVASPSLQGK